VPIVLKSGSLNLLEPSEPVQACNGIALHFTIQNNDNYSVRVTSGCETVTHWMSSNYCHYYGKYYPEAWQSTGRGEAPWTLEFRGHDMLQSCPDLCLTSFQLSRMSVKHFPNPHPPEKQQWSLVQQTRRPRIPQTAAELPSFLGSTNGCDVQCLQ